MKTFTNMEFIFVRHGKTDWNVGCLLKGIHDLPLNSIGIEQARKTCYKLDNFKIDQIVSSTLKRAKETAEIIAKHLNQPVSSICIYKDIDERHYGTFIGRERVELDNLPKDAETEAKFQSRVLKGFKTILYKAHAEKQKILVAAHNGVFNLVNQFLIDDHKEQRLDYAQAAVFSADSKGTWRMSKL